MQNFLKANDGYECFYGYGSEVSITFYRNINVIRFDC